MKNIIVLFISVFCMTLSVNGQQAYQPTQENQNARKQFANDRFGIFIHWGIYSTYAQGEWYLQEGKLNKDEYAKAATYFAPIRFDAHQWFITFQRPPTNKLCPSTPHHRALP